LDAVVSAIQANASSVSEAAGAATNADAGARVETFDVADVSIANLAAITGTDTLYIHALHQKVDTEATATSGSISGGGDTNANAVNHPSLWDQVTTEIGSHLTTHDLLVQTIAAPVATYTLATRSNFFIDFGSANADPVITPKRFVTFDADVDLLDGPSPLLEINEAGDVIQAVNLHYQEIGGTINVLDIVNKDPGKVRFEADTMTGPGAVFSVIQNVNNHVP